MASDYSISSGINLISCLRCYLSNFSTEKLLIIYVFVVNRYFKESQELKEFQEYLECSLFHFHTLVLASFDASCLNCYYAIYQGSPGDIQGIPSTWVQALAWLFTLDFSKAHTNASVFICIHHGLSTRNNPHCWKSRKKSILPSLVSLTIWGSWCY